MIRARYAMPFVVLIALVLFAHPSTGTADDPPSAPSDAADIALPLSPGEPRNFDLLSSIPGDARAIAVRERLAYVGMAARLAIFDVADPTHPILLGETADFPRSSAAQKIAVAARPQGGHRIYAYVVAGEIGMWIIDVTNPFHPVEVGFYGTPYLARSVAVSGNIAYVTDFLGGLRIVNVADPTRPIEIAAYGLSFVSDVVVEDATAYVINASGLAILDVSDPSQPARRADFYTSAANALAVVADRVYLAGVQRLQLVNIADRDHPTAAGDFYAWDSFRRIAVRGDIVYLGGDILRAVNVADPTHIVEAGAYGPGGRPADVAVAGGVVFLASADAGVTLLRYRENLALTGRTLATAGRAYTFTARPNPLNATQPVIYVWQAADQTPVVHIGGLSDTVSLAWNTAGVKTITASATTFSGTLTATHTITVAQPPGQLRLGADLLPDDLRGIGLTADLGYDTAQYYVSWREIEPCPGCFEWWRLDRMVDEAATRDVRLVFRIYEAPWWAQPPPDVNAPARSEDVAGFVQALVERYGTRVAGYVIWNEPNLPMGWEGRPLDARAYVEMLRAAYQAAKRANPDVTIVSAGLAPTQGGYGAISDIVFLQQMYDAGLDDVADVVGMNGLGFASAPDDASDPNGYNFLRLTRLRQVMVANAAADKPAWALEVGWVADIPLNLGSFEWWKVSELRQARYLKRAIAVAGEWPWLTGLFIWNLNFGPHDIQPEKQAFAIQGRLAYRCVAVGPTPDFCTASVYLPLVLRIE